MLDEPTATDSDASVLSPDEIARAGRFQFEKDRIHFTRCRSALRQLLAGYLAIPAAEVRFEYLTSGKPQAVNTGWASTSKKSATKSIQLRWLSDSSHFANAAGFRGCRIISACRASLPAGRARKPS